MNSALLTGPDLLQNLLHVLNRFREFRFAVSADIEAMFSQVGVLPSDQPSLQFLWREAPTNEIVLFQYTRHIFGSKDSPTCANYALRRTATDNESTYPDAALAVKEKFYMDDYLESMETSEEVLTRSQALLDLLNKGGFKLRKFVSNVQEIADKRNGNTESCQKQDEAKGFPDTLGNSSHVLGLKWYHTTDTLIVSRGTDRTVQTPLTQRSVLSLVSSVFDPIGLVAPFTVKACLILEEIWRLSGQEWDNELPKETAGKITEWTLDLPRLLDIKSSKLLSHDR